MAGAAEIDFEAEGLLDDLEGEAREARLALLRELAAEGVSLEELREAVAAGRLTLLPVERALAGAGRRYTAREIAEIAGIDLELLRRFSAALGVPYTDPDEPRGTEADLEAARRMKAFRDAGLPEDGMLQVARTIGMGTARIAEANRELVIRTLTQPGDTERDLALRFAAAAEYMLPLVGPTLVYALQANMLEQIRRDVIGAADLASGEIGGTVELTICFADLVEFTRLGEEIAAEELGLVAGRLEEMATRGRRAAGAAGEDDRRRGDAGLDRGRADAGDGVAGADRRRRGRRRGVPAGCAPASPAARRCPSPATTTAARSTSPAASPASPGPAASLARRGDQGGGGGGLHLHLHRRAPPQGHRLQVKLFRARDVGPLGGTALERGLRAETSRL